VDKQFEEFYILLFLLNHKKSLARMTVNKSEKELWEYYGKIYVR
jgi:hypothetical protein